MVTAEITIIITTVPFHSNSTMKRKLTSSDEEPVGVVGSQLVLDGGLHEVSPLGDNELIVVLEDLSVSSNEIRGGDVTHSNATSSFSHLQ
jgi:hypothetical protein